MRFWLKWGTWVLAAMAPAWANDADPRPLTTAETQQFLPVICPKVIGHDQKMVLCDHLVGLPGDQGKRLGIYLSAVAYGDFRGTGREQAYVSYDGDFEPHATNFGGGILFQRRGAGWTVAGWYSGGQMDECVALPLARVQRLLCLAGYSGSGEFDSSVWLRTVPRPEDAQRHADPAVLKAQDDRESGFDEDLGNYQCTLPHPPGRAILLSIEKLRRSSVPGILAEADITSAKPADVARACRKKHFAEVHVTRAVVQFKLAGNAVQVVAPEKFTNTDY